jgi:hypothetical protein
LSNIGFLQELLERTPNSSWAYGHQGNRPLSICCALFTIKIDILVSIQPSLYLAFINKLHDEEDNILSNNEIIAGTNLHKPMCRQGSTRWVPRQSQKFSFSYAEILK